MEIRVLKCTGEKLATGVVNTKNTIHQESKASDQEGDWNGVARPWASLNI